jgi:hypothetical protein
MTRTISSRWISITLQAVMAVAVVMCSPPTVASDSSPMKSPVERSVMVASLPFFETTVSFGAAALKIKERVSEIPLREKGLLWFQLDDSSAQASFSEKCGSVECRYLELGHLHAPFQKAATPIRTF